MGSISGQVKPKAMKLVFVASPLNTQHKGERSTTVSILLLFSAKCSATSWREQVNFH
jgi:hypothetical protein